MHRILREIARDVTRVTGAPIAQILIIRPHDGEGRAETLASCTAPPVTAALAAEVVHALEEDPGAAAAAPLLGDEPPPRVIAPSGPSLDALAARALGTPATVSVFHRLASGLHGVTLLRVVLPAAPRGAALHALDAAARLAAGRVEAEGFRSEIAGWNAAYRTFQEGAGDAILVVHALTGRVLEANEKMSELAGVGRRELVRRTLGELLEHAILDPAALLARLGSGRVVREDEARIRRRRGEAVPVAITATRFELQGEPVLHLLARDATRERRALAELRQAKDTLAALHLAGAHLTVETDEAAIYGVLARELSRLGFHSGVLAPALDGGSGLVWRFLSFPLPVRRQFERVLGRPVDAARVDPIAVPLVRRCLVERRTVHTDATRGTVQALLGGATPRQLRRLGRLVGIRRVILAPLRREGRPVAVLVVAAPKPRKGDPEAIDAFALQASIALEKARLFGALREERARLETEVDRRTAELTRAVAALEETDRRKDNFLANISHELRTPLVTVLGYADLLLAEKLGEVGPRQRAALQVVATSARRLKAFIEELLDLSRHELTRDAYAFAPCDLSDVVTQAILALAPRFSERGLRVRARVARRTPRVWADRERILQVLVNLLANAERYSPDGSPIRVAAAEVAPGRVAISVSDRGAGIAPEHLDNIFDRLYQVRDDRSPRHKGGALGIGLAIVKSIVEAHGGEVTVRSRVGRGTTFRFTLPPPRDDAPGDAPAATTAAR
jgi:PAS domain S-box-containing protein